MQPQIPLSKIKALNGKIYAQLTADEIITLDYYRHLGRKYGVSLSMINDADSKDLASANSEQEAKKILHRGNVVINVFIGD